MFIQTVMQSVKQSAVNCPADAEKTTSHSSAAVLTFAGYYGTNKPLFINQ